MNRIFGIGLLIISFNCFGFVDDPERIFDVSDNFTNKSTIEWVGVDDVQEECERRSKKFGNGGFGGVSLEACSFYYRRDNKDICIVITDRRARMITIAHEMLHCFAGQWHE